MAQRPSDEGDRGADRFERARRLGDEQARVIAFIAPAEFVGDRLDVPIILVGIAWRDRIENLLDECREVLAQDRVQLVDVIGNFLRCLRTRLRDGLWRLAS